MLVCELREWGNEGCSGAQRVRHPLSYLQSQSNEIKEGLLAYPGSAASISSRSGGISSMPGLWSSITASRSMEEKFRCWAGSLLRAVGDRLVLGFLVSHEHSLQLQRSRSRRFNWSCAASVEETAYAASEHRIPRLLRRSGAHRLRPPGPSPARAIMLAWRPSNAISGVVS